MFVPLLTFGLGLFIGFVLWHKTQKEPEWRLQIIMDIVSGSSYPLNLKLTRNGKASSLPKGAVVAWGDSDPALGAVSVDPNDATKATIVAGDAGATGAVTAKVTFTGADGNAKEVDATSEALTVVVGEPDAGSIDVGAELP